MQRRVAPVVFGIGIRPRSQQQGHDLKHTNISIPTGPAGYSYLNVSFSGKQTINQINAEMFVGMLPRIVDCCLHILLCQRQKAKQFSLFKKILYGIALFVIQQKKREPDT
jgi:hypothetical protein